MSSAALCLTALLLLVPIVISYKKDLHIIKDLAVTSTRTIVRLLILGLMLKYIFKIDQVWVLLIAVLVITINASWNIIHRASPVMHHVFWISFVSISISIAVPLACTVLAGVIDFKANDVIPIGGMLTNNGLVTINLAYQNLGRAFAWDIDDIESKLTLVATSKLALKGTIRGSIRSTIIPIVDSVETYGLVSIPGTMIGSTAGDMVPSQAIKFQLPIVFIHTTAVTMLVLAAMYLGYGQFFNARHRLVARTANIKDND